MHYFNENSYILLYIFEKWGVLVRKTKAKKEKKFIPVPESLSTEPKIEILGNREIIIDGCKGVVEYGENLIKLSTGELVIAFEGIDLLVKSFDNQIAIINGNISEISFIK